MKDNSTNKYYTISEHYKLKHYRLPKALFTTDKYRGLDNDTKIAYAILADRVSLSIKNGWVDNKGDYFFIYTVTDLAKILNRSESKVKKIKKELINADLLVQERVGFNKPNKLYLKHLDLLMEDVDKSIESPGDQPSGSKKPNQENEGKVKKIPRDGQIKPPSDIEVSDPNLDTFDTLKESKLVQEEQDKLFKESLKDYMPKLIFQTLNTFSKDYFQMKEWYSILLRAKAKCSKERKFLIFLEDFEHEVNEILIRAIRQIRTNRDIRKREGYLFKTFYNEFNNLVDDIEDS